MKTIRTLVISVDQVSLIPNCERYFPEPKLGNLKDPAKIQDKLNEHFARMSEEAYTNSLLATPAKVSVCVVEKDVPDEDEETGLRTSMSSVSRVGQVEVFEGELEALGTFLNGLENVVRILGPHPTTQSRVVQNSFIRAKIAVPKCLGVDIPRVNVFQQICTTQEGEYPVCVAPLGLAVSTPIEDTLKVANLLGMI